MPSISKGSTEPSIDTFWLADEDHIDVDAITVPFPRHELILNLGDTFEVGASGKHQTWLFSPIATEAIRTRALGKYQALGMLLNPIGVYSTFGINMREFTEQATLAPSELLFGKGTEFLQRLEQASSAQEKLKMFETFIQTNSLRKPIPGVVTNLLNAFSRTQMGTFELKDMAQGLGFSTKHLISSFKDVVGITPKKYALLLQINAAVHCTWKNPQRRFTDIALECGFFDQSHFIRVFKKIAGTTPFEFRHRQNLKKSEFANTMLH